MLVERRYVLLVAREPVEGLGDDDLELTPSRILKQLLVARAQADRPADRMISVAGNQGPALVVDPSLAGADLILDRF
jgi:hypothetical protein